MFLLNNYFCFLYQSDIDLFIQFFLFFSVFDLYEKNILVLFLELIVKFLFLL